MRSKLSSPLPLNMVDVGNPCADPWLLVLASGATCEEVTGATTTVDGDPVRTHAVWTILSSASQDSGPVTPVPIARALE